MSYDLFFKPRSGQVDREQFAKYFNARPHYSVGNDQAWYRNEDTGTYFVFEYSEPATDDSSDNEGESSHPLSFNINYFRPSFFGKEAEPELTAFVSNFDLEIEDPQVNGMGVGSYDSARFFSGWNEGNEFGYQAMVRQDRSANVFTLPTLELERIWRWNLAREQRQAKLGENKFVPKIMFLDLNGAAVSAVVWPDAIPSLIPKVDHLLIHREQLAPKRLFRKKPDTVLVSWSAVESLIREHSVAIEPAGTEFLLGYDVAPEPVIEFVSNLTSTSQELKGIAPDSVLNAEIVAKYAV